VPDLEVKLCSGDISIGGFLLKDTIDMNNPDEYMTTQALLAPGVGK